MNGDGHARSYDVERSRASRRHRGTSGGLARLVLAALAVVAGTACQGTIDGDVDPAASVPTPPPRSTAPTGPMGGKPGGAAPAPTMVDDLAGGPPCNPAQKSFAPARLWQLTDAQYVNVVRDVFGITLTGEDAQIVSAGSSEVYTGHSEGIAIGAQVAPNYQTTAAKVAGLAVAKIEGLVGSPTPTPEQIQGFLTTTVARAWRRPVSPDEVGALMKIYTEAADDPANAFSLILQAVLQAPSFLYRTEIGSNAATAKAPVEMTPFELASALSFFLLETSPDDSLWAKAQDNTLADPVVLAAEVDRLMQLPAARANLTRKASYWLGLESLPSKLRDERLYPEYTETLKAAVYKGVQSFLTDTLWGGKFSDLFTSSKVYVNREMGQVYGIPGAMRGGVMTAVTVPGAQRSAGILTQPGLLLASNKWNERADPIHRGLMIYNSFVCAPQIPPPPANAATVAATFSGTERDKANMRAALPACSGCHHNFDPLGLTFERYDAIGRYSETRQAVLDPSAGMTSWTTSATPIDTSATVSEGLGPELAGPVAGLGALAARLAGANARVSYCAARKLAEYSLGHNPDAENSCELKAVKNAFVKSGSFTEFFRALALSPGFRTRDPLGQ